MSAAAALLLACWSGAAPVGGHPPLKEPESAAKVRRAALEEMWRRRILPPDQSVFAEEERALLERMRRADAAGVGYLGRKPGGSRPWTVKLEGGPAGRVGLSKEGFERYLALLTQEAIVYFERKGGAGAKDVFRYTDWDGQPLFDGRGRLTEAGEAVYRKARLNQEVFWRSPSGAVFGTRRPPAPRQE